MAITKHYTEFVEPLITPGCAIVDVGCGDAEFWADMQRRRKAVWGKLTGIDIDILKARAAEGRKIINCDITLGDAFKALKLLESNSSDITVGLNLVDYLSPPNHPQKAQAVLLAMKRITKENGRLIFTIGSYEAGVAMQRFNDYKVIEQTKDMIKLHVQSVMYITGYTEAYAKAWIKRLGLEVVMFKVHRLTVKELKEKFPEIPDAQVEVYSELPIDYVFVCRKK